jgi:hypothetical protein
MLSDSYMMEGKGLKQPRKDWDKFIGGCGTSGGSCSVSG